VYVTQNNKQQNRLVFGLVLLIYYHTLTHLFNGLFSGITRVNKYQKGKTNLDFTEARDSDQCADLHMAQLMPLLLE